MTFIIEIVDYDPRWPVMYEMEKAAILHVIGDRVVEVEHIGSTAVPGLSAKPVIDIMAAVRKLGDVELCVKPLENIGYEYLGEYGVPGRRIICMSLSKQAICGKGICCFATIYGRIQKLRGNIRT